MPPLAYPPGRNQYAPITAALISPRLEGASSLDHPDVLPSDHWGMNGAAVRQRRETLLGLGLAVCMACGCETMKSPPSGGDTAAVAAHAGAVLDLENRSVDPFRNSRSKVIVFLFVRTDCPISNRYAPEMERLYEKYSARKVEFWLVYPDSDTDAGAITQHRKDFRLSIPALRDPNHVIVKRASASATPEAAVFLDGGREVYRGRIDNRYVDFGKERPEPTERDLDQALEAVLSGKAVANPRTVAVGCYLAE